MSFIVFSLQLSLWWSQVFYFSVFILNSISQQWANFHAVYLRLIFSNLHVICVQMTPRRDAIVLHNRSDSITAQEDIIPGPLPQQISANKWRTSLNSLRELDTLANSPSPTNVFQTAGRPDEVIAAETLENYKRCNNSFIQGLFQAQYRSSLSCSRCLTQSNTFDPFQCISVQLPQLHRHTIYVTVSVCPIKSERSPQIRISFRSEKKLAHMIGCLVSEYDVEAACVEFKIV